MPYRAQNAVPVGSQFQAPAQFDSPHPVYKLDLYVNGVDVLMEVLEWGEKGWPVEDAERQILLRRGFNSRPFLTPIGAWRFKEWSGSINYKKVACTVDIVTFG